MKKRLNITKGLASAAGLLLLMIILIVLNWIVSHANIRWDVTEDKVYSLSEGTKNILSEMVEPVTVKFFWNRSNRNFPGGLKIYANRVREFLAEYERAGRGRVVVEVHDPKADSDEEEWARKYGLKPIGQSDGERLYCGLVFLFADRETAIPVLDPTRETFLEYDMTRIIHQLQIVEKRRVGIISTLPVFGDSQPVNPMERRPSTQRWFFVVELEKTYRVERVDLAAKTIDPGLDLLMILHPREIDPALQYAVDQYVLAGGNALVFADPFCLSDRSQPRQPLARSSGPSMSALFASWGISWDPDKGVADLDQATKLRGRNNQVENHPMWISARGEAFSREDLLTSKLESMLLPVAGAIEKSGDADHEFEPLVRSGKHAALTDAFKAAFGAAAVRRDFISAGKEFNLAVRVRGLFKTAFPDGPPTGEDTAKNEEQPPGGPKGLKKSEKRATVIVVADADLLADEFYVRKSRFLGFDMSKVFNDNLNFLSNACEILTGSDNLIGLRTRGAFERPFTAVMALERRAQERWLSKEKELLDRVERTNRKLRELEQRKDDSQRLIVSPEQEAEIARFKAERHTIRRELKQVRKNLRADIESLGNRLKAINLFLMPLLIAIAGIFFALYRQKRMKIR
ncbi:MAG: Gldg family protein [Deltaproteobacteria bacterium]|nr:Gldg family protein [Deltaproteobacteria bacterium]MBW1816267.1 Gldg family protein [Deltaproteobacteria bacterium]MBW2283591.1 Gldg family protein [Deltaproteobacteria bacterium]